MSISREFLDSIKTDDKGLFPAIIQDKKTGQVLMLAYMNKEALIKTFETKKTHFWSRSRQKYWMKGESSGHVQHVESMSFDCDKDALVVKVRQDGGIACHMGYESCFFRYIDSNGEETKDQPLKDPKDIYKNK